MDPMWQMLAFSKVTVVWAATLLWPLLRTLTSQAVVGIPRLRGSVGMQIAFW